MAQATCPLIGMKTILPIEHPRRRPQGGRGLATGSFVEQPT